MLLSQIINTRVIKLVALRVMHHISVYTWSPIYSFKLYVTEQVFLKSISEYACFIANKGAPSWEM